MKYVGECAYLICKYYSILYKRLERLWILVSMGVPGTNSSMNTGYQGIDDCKPSSKQRGLWNLARDQAMAPHPLEVRAFLFLQNRVHT